jgi:hypothetical protein
MLLSISYLDRWLSPREHKGIEKKCSSQSLKYNAYFISETNYHQNVKKKLFQYFWHQNWHFLVKIAICQFKTITVKHFWTLYSKATNPSCITKCSIRKQSKFNNILLKFFPLDSEEKKKQFVALHSKLTFPCKNCYLSI